MINIRDINMHSNNLNEDFEAFSEALIQIIANGKFYTLQ